ncbi:hypothetical protein SDC9_139266 [bioreactor metagenome]|uniref:Uncharacterized protein n=1 Tax=bioreactor metagenome TaxID=1076179 RepID=A0A645DUW0_9ZZZZ
MRGNIGYVAAFVGIAAERQSQPGSDHIVPKCLIDAAIPINVERGEKRIGTLPEFEFVHPSCPVAPVAGHDAATVFEIAEIAERIFRMIEEYCGFRVGFLQAAANFPMGAIPDIRIVKLHFGPIDARR